MQSDKTFREHTKLAKTVIHCLIVVQPLGKVTVNLLPHLGSV